MKNIQKFKYLNIPAGKQGYTVFFAALVASLALAVGLAIYDLTVREVELSRTATQSQYAIYAADTGAECALFWDNKYQWSGSAFATTSAYTPAGSIVCNGQTVSITPTAGASAATTTFTLLFSPQPYCAAVTIAKVGNPAQTTLVSRGYNTSCPPTETGIIRLERALRVSY